MTFVGLPPPYAGTYVEESWFQFSDCWARAHDMDAKTQGRKMPASLDREAFIVYLMLPEDRRTLKDMKEALEAAVAPPNE